MSLDGLDTPALVLDAGVLRGNVAAMAARARSGGVALRPHAKTHKMPEVARLQLDAGAVGLTVAKLGEAEVFADAGVEDVLIAYPIVGARKLERLVALARRIRVAVSLDDAGVARALSAAAVAGGVEIGVRVEVDTGLRRVGVAPGRAVAGLAQVVAALPGVRFEGIMTHEGQAYAAGGTEELRRATHAACASMVESADAVRETGLEVPVVSVGSSATARFAAMYRGITEIRPGTYVFNDRTQVAHGAAKPGGVATSVLTTVVSRPAADVAVIDAGTKALTSDRMNVPGAATDFGAVAGSGWPVIRASEEHGIVAIPAGESPRVGDRMSIVPNHICPVVNLFDEAVVVEDGRVAARWSVAARGRTT